MCIVTILAVKCLGLFCLGYVFFKLSYLLVDIFDRKGHYYGTLFNHVADLVVNLFNLNSGKRTRKCSDILALDRTRGRDGVGYIHSCDLGFLGSSGCKSLGNLL